MQSLAPMAPLRGLDFHDNPPSITLPTSRAPCPGRLYSVHGESLTPGPLLNHLPFQDNLLSITLLTQSSVPGELNGDHAWVMVYHSSPSPKYNKHLCEFCVPGHFSNDHAGFPLCHYWASCYFNDCFPSIFLLTWWVLYPVKPQQWWCSLSSSVTTEWSVVSRPSPKYNSTQITVSWVTTW